MNSCVLLPTACRTQLSAWEGIMSASYGYPCHFLLARRDGRVEGVLPLFLVDSSLTGRRLDSMPGAACACNSHAANALLLAADQLAHELKIEYLLLRDTHATPGRTATWKCSKPTVGSGAS